MNRESKFRGKSLKSGEWVYGSLIKSLTGATYIMPCLPGPISLECFIEVDPKTVGQYTGIKDKNKKEIYNDDVIQLQGTKVKFYRKKVVFHLGCFGYFGYVGEFNPLGLREGNRGDNNDWIIIGNIHDNPELLEADLD